MAHIETADPYCAELRRLAIDSASRLGLKAHPKGTVVVVQGPRFSSTAESLWFSRMGWDLVNMTQYPEVALAAELGICYLNISVVTDYDVGVYAKHGIAPVSIDQVMAIFKQSTEKLKTLISEIIQNVPSGCACECKQRAERAKIT